MSADERRYYSMRRTPVYRSSGCWKFKMKSIHVCLSVTICYVLNIDGGGVLIFVSIISRSNLCTTEPFNLQAALLLH